MAELAEQIRRVWDKWRHPDTDETAKAKFAEAYNSGPEGFKLAFKVIQNWHKQTNAERDALIEKVAGMEELLSKTLDCNQGLQIQNNYLEVNRLCMEEHDRLYEFLQKHYGLKFEGEALERVKAALKAEYNRGYNAGLTMQPAEEDIATNG